MEIAMIVLGSAPLWLASALGAPVMRADDFEEARRACAALASGNGRLGAIGFGRGGALALLLAEQYPLDAVAAVDARFDDKRLGALCRRNLFAVTSPALIVERGERSALAALGVRRVYGSLSSRAKRLMWLPEGDEGALALALGEFMREAERAIS